MTKTNEASVSKDALSLQDRFLAELQEQETESTFFLVNGVRLTGRVAAFDRFVVLVRDSVTQMVYKHAISTVVPTVVQSNPEHRRSPEIVKRARPRVPAVG